MIPVYDEQGTLVGSMAVDVGQHSGRSIVIPYVREERFWQMELVWGEFVREDGSHILALRVHSSLVEQLRSCRSFSPTES